MHRVTAVTTLALAGLLAVALAITLTAAAPAAPRWPAASLTYWQEAQPILAALETDVRAGLKASGNPAAAQVISDSVTAVTAAIDTIGELEPPPPLLPFHTRLAYAAGACKNTLQYSQGLALAGLAAAVAIPVLTTMGTDCFSAINEANVEAARYASTVGGYPEPAK